MPVSLDRFTTKAAAVIFGVGSVIIVATELTRHYSARFAFTRDLPRVVADLLNGLGSSSFLAFALATAIFAVRCYKDKLLLWFTASFALFLFLQMLVNETDIAPFRENHLWVVSLLEVISCIVAIATIIALPAALRRFQSTIQQAARSQESEAMLLAAAESSTDVILMFEAVRSELDNITDFRFRFVNRAGAEFFGVEAQDLMGKHLYATFPRLKESGNDQKYKQVIETGEPILFECEHTVFKHRGQPARLYVRVVRLDDGVSITATDITDRYLAEEGATKALAFNKAVVDCSPFCTIVTDSRGFITAANPAASMMLLYSTEELIGECLTTLLHEPGEITQRARDLTSELGREVAPNHDIFRVLLECHGLDAREWTYIRKDGTTLPVQLTVTALKDHRGVTIGFVGVCYDITERNEADRYFHHLAHHDPLTGLPTRTLLRDRLEISIERARRYNDYLAVMIVDLDNFKRVNDSLGHQAGDALLCEIAARLRSCVRKSDTVARMGGDEFVILLSDLQEQGRACDIANKILTTISQPVQIGRHKITVTASIGVSIYPECKDIDTLFKNADLAMYRIKARGRNAVQMYTPGIGSETVQKLQMESALRNAIEANELEIVYQPQISFSDHSMIGVEALLRWHSPEFGSVPPNIFIPIAEETGLIVPISEWVLSNACNEIAGLQREVGKDIGLAVNISPRQFQSRNFPATVENALLESGLRAEQLELEITEQLLMIDSDESLEIMQRVRTLGVHFAIDDFGTGFSNMGYITRFQVDRIKIDRSFISKCDTDTNSKAVTAAIIALAHSLNIEVIAEGVETSQHVDMLVQMRCDQAQGYLYSRPLSLKAMRSFAAAAAHPQILGGKSGIRRAFVEFHHAELQKT
jgi:diguanylate cyclase (GGDEF)-like protein/PAS domain S-box-containing protein